MSNNERSSLPIGLAKQRKNGKQRRKPDLRIRRTRSLLSNALVALMQEKSIDKITVQEVLDRATVGRSTFYLHYRDKDDLFLCVLEDGLEMWSTALLRKQEKSYRIAPVAEFFMHVGDAKKLYRASGRFRTYPRVFRTCAGLLRSQYRPTSEGHGPEASGSKRTGCSLACARRKPAVTSEMVARSRRQRVAKGNGRTDSTGWRGTDCNPNPNYGRQSGWH